jgi:DNA adenine methylase
VASPAHRSTSTSPARPFVKWAGGKRQLLPAILSRLPRTDGVFHEPFVGGGAVFFGLRPRAAVLSDLNHRLIRTYAAIKNSVEDVIELLSTYPHNRDFFLQLRTEDVDKGSDVAVAAWFLYLNKVGFNGLYRVNARNRFNVPFGNNPRATICDAANLRACAAALGDVDLRCEDFSAVLGRARPGDVVYFDPPYVPASRTAAFTAYTATRFGEREQLRLRDVARELRARGTFVLLSNSAAAAQYYDGEFACVAVSARRALNCKPRLRGATNELLIS